MNDASQDGRSPPPAPRLATRVVAAGRDPKSYHGFVNPPVYHTAAHCNELAA
jgi:cystathionine beta-lyase/cystathionine gamma-synthase